MSWKTGPNAALGVPAVTLTAAAIDTVAAVPVGTITTFVDDAGTQLSGEFIYLPGVASVVAGDLIAYDLLPSGPTIVRLTAALAANSGRNVAVAIAPVVAANFGWFQISGVAIVNIAGAGVVGPLFATATAGSGSSATTAGSQLLSARISAAVGTPSAGKSYATINRPTCQSQIT